MTLEETIKNAETRMQKTASIYQKDLQAMRADRLSPALLSNIRCNYHGQQTQIEHLSRVTAGSDNSLVIQAWDDGAVEPIAKALQTSDLNCNPQIEGNVIRLKFPPLSRERRLELVKVAHKRAEEARVGVRNIRRDELNAMRKIEKNGECSQDEAKRYEKRLQGLTNQFIQQIDKFASDKERDLTQV